MVMKNSSNYLKVMTKILPSFQYEKEQWDNNLKFVAGIDEVGRGCFAGPVVAGSVVFPPHYIFNNPLLKQINDSKKLSIKKRIELSELIYQEALSVSISVISVEVINEKGIGQATQDAFTDAILGLNVTPQFILSDAFCLRDFSKEIQMPVIKGDCHSYSIAAASIVAKVYRDNLMLELDKEFPSYDFKTNMGYGTKAHRDALKIQGLSLHHRTSFSLGKYL